MKSKFKVGDNVTVIIDNAYGSELPKGINLTISSIEKFSKNSLRYRFNETSMVLLADAIKISENQLFHEHLEDLVK